MTKLLLRLFIKGPQDTDSPAVRAAYGRLSGIVGIVCNLLLFLGKLMAGMLTGSVSITADAVNNLSDASSALVTILGFKMAEKPADAGHPFGHARIEYLSGLAVAALILIIGIDLAKQSLFKILRPEPVVFSAAAAVVLIVSIGVKLWLSLFNRRLSRAIHSTTLAAAAADSRNDVIATGAVLAAALIEQATHLQVDGWMGLLVAIFILWSGVSIARDTIDPLLGSRPDPALRDAIARQLRQSDKVLGFHDLMVHDYGPGRRFASVHVEMDMREDVMLCHDIIDDIERDCLEQLNVHLVIHYDPIVTDDPELNRLRALLRKAAEAVDPRLSIHDFRMVRGPVRTNLIFDVIIPYELNDRKPQIKQILDRALENQPGQYNTVITFDEDAFRPEEPSAAQIKKSTDVFNTTRKD